jgi:hypothetical protein
MRRPQIVDDQLSFVDPAALRGGIAHGETGRLEISNIKQPVIGGAEATKQSRALSFRGASETSETGIHFSSFTPWIPGSMLAHCPGMTKGWTSERSQ